jgi:hypothetical protein
MCEPSPQPALRWPPPTECLRDSFALEDSSAPCCINFFPPRWSRFPRKALFSFFLVFFFLAIRGDYLNRSRRSISQIPVILDPLPRSLRVVSEARKGKAHA